MRATNRLSLDTHMAGERAAAAHLLEEELPPPVGDALNHNLIMELLVSTTLTTPELHLLEE
jgi:hypothetical protein